jgi:sec-independent protein translocase protein TatB
MFGMGMPELIIILVIALIVIGPKKLPDLAKALGKGMSEFKKATQEIKDNLNLEEELKGAKEDLIDSVSGLDNPSDTPPQPASSDDQKPEPAYKDFDEMLEDYESRKEGKEKQKPPEPEASAPAEAAPEAEAEKNRHDG